MVGRPLGSRELSSDQINMIVELSEKGKSRPEIADRVNCGKKTVYRYQKKFGYV